VNGRDGRAGARLERQARMWARPYAIREWGLREGFHNVGMLMALVGKPIRERKRSQTVVPLQSPTPTNLKSAHRLLRIRADPEGAGF
jgi:hypothetical protein